MASTLGQAVTIIQLNDYLCRESIVHFLPIKLIALPSCNYHRYRV